MTTSEHADLIEREGWHQVITVFPKSLTTVAYRYESGGWWIPDPEFNEASLVGATITPLFSFEEYAAALASTPSPAQPTEEDEREALINAVYSASSYRELPGSAVVFMESTSIADAILAAGFRRAGDQN